MRLIDADAMLERNKSSIYDTTDLKEMLKYEPTAYDVDEVVAQLTEKAIGIPTIRGINMVIAENTAINIVRGGGVNE